MTSIDAELVERLAAAAADAAPAWAALSAQERAGVIHSVADALDAATQELAELAHRETNLPMPRLTGEVFRTTFQLRLLADAAARGDYLDLRIDRADPVWPMGPRPDLRRMNIPLGPVVVFAASNFPFAFSVAGGDTASALAAGCPVIVKTHEGHPELSARTAQLVGDALAAAGAPTGVFAAVSSREAGRLLLQDSRIKAGAFTGSVPAGRALFDIACSRPDPIPFFGELGSVNPVIVTPRADAERAAEVVTGFIDSFTLGSGQFCTNPGLLFVPRDGQVLRLLSQTELPDGTPMLGERFAQSFVANRSRMLGQLDTIAEGSAVDELSPAPILVRSSVAQVSRNPDLLDEWFGPASVVIEYEDTASGRAALLSLIAGLPGQLTGTIQGVEGDDLAPSLVGPLSSICGRILWNGWSTGVTVCDAQFHGGPYPATTVAGTTSVGSSAIDRFVRPVAWQGFPAELLPAALRDAAQVAAGRLVEGRRVLPTGS